MKVNLIYHFIHVNIQTVECKAIFIYFDSKNYLTVTIECKLCAEKLQNFDYRRHNI